MLERLGVDRRIKCTVDVLEDVAVEGRSDAIAVVVRCVEHLGVFFEVHPQQESPIRSQGGPFSREKPARSLRLEVADA